MLSPLYGQLSPLRIPTKSARVLSADADANTYLLAVESADGQQLEDGVITAVESFVLGCKSDGIWTALKASCILAGARTLSGALVPLVGTAPTNYNFVSGDYDRETGLKGNGSTKRLISNRSNNADPQNSRHIAVWVSERHNRNALYVSTITTLNGSGDSYIYQSANFIYNTVKIASAGIPSALGGTNLLNGFFGASRASGSNISARRQNATVDQNTNSVTPVNENLVIFGTSSYYSNGRLSFYSIGEGINLALLDTRVSNLMTALAAAIP
jgi:hypothetical protein